MQVTAKDMAELKAHGYKVSKWGKGWILNHVSDPDPHNALMIGSHGCVSPTQWEAVAEAQLRIEQDARCTPASDTLAASADAIRRAEQIVIGANLKPRDDR